MSDHERGAYTPPTGDAPLSFDPRRPVRGARPIPVTLILSVLVLAALVAAIFMFYRSGVRQAAEAPQVVGAPMGGIKAPATPETQPQDPAAGLQIYKADDSGAIGAAPPEPAFVPPPEQPQARPTAPVVVTQAPPAATAQALKPAIPAPAVTTPPPAAKPASPPPAKATPAPAKPAPVKPAPAPKVVPPAARWSRSGRSRPRRWRTRHGTTPWPPRPASAPARERASRRSNAMVERSIARRSPGSPRRPTRRRSAKNFRRPGRVASYGDGGGLHPGVFRADADSRRGGPVCGRPAVGLHPVRAKHRLAGSGARAYRRCWWIRRAGGSRGWDRLTGVATRRVAPTAR